jgi:Family of unknown function (DUF6318)
MRHYSGVGRIWTFAAFVLLSCAACTSSGDGSPASSSVSSGPTATPTVSVPPPTTSAPSSSHVGPPKPPQPSLPADVPTTGPNTRAGEKPPIMPLEATQHTPDGAKAFAEFFIKTIDWGYATTSSTYMRHYFQKSCIGCRSTADALDKARRQQHHFIGDRFTIRSVSETGRATSTTIHLLATFDVQSVEVVDEHGESVDASPAVNGFRERVSASWLTDHWLVHEFAAQP